MSLARNSLRALAAVALGVVAVYLRAGLIPFRRHLYDGHELDYLRVFQGAELGDSTRLYPTLAWLYRQLGAISDDPNLLLWLALAVGVATVGAAGVAVGRRFGERAGWIAAILVAASPAHAFWSTSAYNVALPQLLLVSAIAARGWTGAALYACACLFRVELMLLAPAVAVMAGADSRAHWKRARIALGALGGLALIPLLETAPPLHSPLTVLPVNLLIPHYLGPLGTTYGVIIVLLTVERRSLSWLLAAAWVHLVGSCFDDYGWRHGLLGGLALIGVVASDRKLLWGPLAICALAVSLVGLKDVARWYYAPAADFETTLRGRDLPALTEPLDCHEILDDPLDPRSHWFAQTDWPDGEVCWGEEAIHYTWNSRGLMTRRLRMHRVYTLTPRGVLKTPGGPRLYYTVER